MEFKMFKIIVFTPMTHADTVRTYLGKSGCGALGNYDSCSFSSKGTGRFRPLDDSQPFIGDKGRLETVEEEKIEVVCEASELKRVIKGLIEAHPYDEPAIDIIPVLDYHSLL